MGSARGLKTRGRDADERCGPYRDQAGVGAGLLGFISFTPALQNPSPHSGNATAEEPF